MKRSLPGASCGDHLADSNLRDDERAVEVDVENVVPFIIGDVEEGPFDFDAGVVDDDVEAAELGDDIGDHFFNFGAFAHVCGDRERGGGKRRDFGAGGGIACSSGEVIDGDVRPFGSEAFGDAAADAGVGAGDEGDFVFESHGNSLSGAMKSEEKEVCPDDGEDQRDAQRCHAQVKRVGALPPATGEAVCSNRIRRKRGS